MENFFAENLIRRALYEYDTVQEELSRPQEDLVLIAACELIQKSVADFLTAYLFEKDVILNPNEDLLVLQKACAKLDPSFLELDLSIIAHLNEDLALTTAMEQRDLDNYLDLLRRTKDTVLDSMGEASAAVFLPQLD